jgi:hypothetical protein
VRGRGVRVRTNAKYLILNDIESRF